MDFFNKLPYIKIEIHYDKPDPPSYLKPIYSVFSVRSLTINGIRSIIMASASVIMTEMDHNQDLSMDLFTKEENKNQFKNIFTFCFLKNMASTLTLRILEHKLVDTIGEYKGKQYFEHCPTLARSRADNQNRFELSKDLFFVSLKSNLLSHVAICLVNQLYIIIKYIMKLRDLDRRYLRYKSTNKQEEEHYMRNKVEEIVQYTRFTVHNILRNIFICCSSVLLEACGVFIGTLISPYYGTYIFETLGGNFMYSYFSNRH